MAVLDRPDAPTFEWQILIPAHRYLYSLGPEGIVEHATAGESSAERFRRYQELKPLHAVHAMIVWPNSLLLRSPDRVVIVDPGLFVQGPPLLLALAQRGLAPEQVDLVVNTHLHADHSQANVLFPWATLVVHRSERESYPEGPPGGSLLPSVRLLEGERGEIAPGLEFLLTPGHSPGSISLLVHTSEGLVVLAGDTVGPLPEYFDRMDLPEDFPDRETILDSWKRLRELGAVALVPGHNPPIRL